MENVRLVDSMPRENLDTAIVQAARVSYGAPAKKSTDRALIRHLMRHWHTSPFEMVEFKFHIKMPIFVARQHFRHRTASINEISGRYAEVENNFFVPQVYRSQSTINKQCSDGDLQVSPELYQKPIKHNEQAFEIYDELIEAGVSRELARCHLPQSTFTEFYWKINLHNLLHYLQLRMAPDAQQEIREYANQIFAIIEPMLPVTMEAFKDFRLDAVTLSGPEVKALQTGNFYGSHREMEEFVKKRDTLGIPPPSQISQ